MYGILTGITLAALGTYGILSYDELQLQGRFRNIMLTSQSCRVEKENMFDLNFNSKSKPKKIIKTFALTDITKTDYGYMARVNIPDGLSHVELEKMKTTLEDNFKCNIEITHDIREGTFIKFIEKSFKDIDYKPVECKPNEILLGYDITEKPFIVDMNRKPHVLIAGQTGTGKSRLAMIILANLIANFKNNLEIHINSITKNSDFSDYAEYEPVIFHEGLDEVRKCYEEIEKEIIKRDNLFRQKRVRNIEEYNAKSQNIMKYVYIYADEFSFYQPDDSDSDDEKESKKYSMAMLKRIVKEGRSYGIFIILAIQVTTYDEMPLILRRQANVHVSFGQIDPIASRVIIGTDDAVNLKDREAIVLIKDYTHIKTYTIDSKILSQYINPKKKEKPLKSPVNDIKAHFTVKPIPQGMELKFKKYKEEKKTPVINYSIGYGKAEKAHRKKAVLNVDSTE